MHALVLVQDTVLSAVPPGVSGGGVLTNFHAVPFHDSARVNSVEFFGVPSLPTAMQLVLLVQETPFKLAPLWVSFGVGTTDQEVPFQDSANGCRTVKPPGSVKT
jgi:hypothetical protein